MKNLKNLGKALTNAEQKTINGGKMFYGGGYQCCNQWGCGACVTGSSMDCTVHDHGSNNEVYGQAC